VHPAARMRLQMYSPHAPTTKVHSTCCRQPRDMTTCPCAQSHLAPIETSHGVFRVSDSYAIKLLTISSSLKCARARSTRSIESLPPLPLGSDRLLTGLMRGAHPVITSHGNSGHHFETVSGIRQLSSKWRRRHRPGA